MNEITHEQAHRYLLAAEDGLLDENEQRALEEHLRTCASCQKEAEELNKLHCDLEHVLQSHWNEPPLPTHSAATALLSPEPLHPRLVRILLNLIVIGLWFWLYRSMLDYLKIIFSDEEFRTNQLLLGFVLVLVFVQLRRQKPHLRIDALPHMYWPGLTLLIGGSACYLLVERYLDINTLSASLFGLATFGLIGLWISPRHWLASLPAALLLIGVLPFGDHLETFVGYPMRLATAEVIQRGLAAIGIHSVGVDTILIMESGLAQIDLPCSGVKSLWTGLLFLIAATWLDRRSINLRWFGVAILVGCFLFFANIARIAVLVVVGEVVGWEMVAELIHVPLGVLAFLAVCGVSLLLLKRQPTTSPSLAGWLASDHGSLVGPGKRPVWLALSLAILIAGMALLYQPNPHTVSAQATIQWALPKEMNTQADPLSPTLYAWVTQDGADFADRWNFQWQEGEQDLRGSLMLLTSNTWRGQHKPERCFEVQGQKVESSYTVIFEEDFPARNLLLSRGPIEVSAVYWLQTGNRVTDDFARRIWADLAPEKEQWVLVTILFDDVYPANSELVVSLARTVREAVANSLEGEMP